MPYDTVIEDITWTTPTGGTEHGNPIGLLGWTGVSSNVPAGETRYGSFFNGGAALSSSATGREWIAPITGRIIALHVQTSSAQPATGALTVRLLVNGIASGVTVTIAAGAVAGIATDLTHAAIVVRGDLIQLDLVNTADAASANVVGISGIMVTP